MTLTAMAEALVKAGMVDENEAKATINAELVMGELMRDKTVSLRKRQLRSAIKKVAEMAESSTNRETIRWHIEDLQSRYSDVFDEVALEELHSLNLK